MLVFCMETGKEGMHIALVRVANNEIINNEREERVVCLLVKPTKGMWTFIDVPHKYQEGQGQGGVGNLASSFEAVHAAVNADNEARVESCCNPCRLEETGWRGYA